MIYTITLNPAIDRLLFLEDTLIKGKNNRLQEITYDLGGKGHHGSYAMSQLEIKNQALGFCGTTNKGKLEKILTEKGINHDLVDVYGKSTRESYVILETGVSGSILITEKGFRVTNYDKESLNEQIERKVNATDIVLIAGSLPLGYELRDLAELLSQLKKIGCFIACDLSGEALKKAVELEVNFIKPNRFEIQELISSKNNLLDNLKELAKKVEYIIVSQGSEGSICSHAGDFYQVTTPKVAAVNDTGAGDCFVGSFLSGLSLGKPLTECLSFASACAASKVQHNDSTTFSVKEARILQKKVTVKKL
ncbi:1-phosphofructokinase [Carnobacterium iners]|uniref:Tagatose-6-phosphate kinase n=1 Tax=Carnobacterium iners TaxID=1073423 RepID=A0A1X7MQA8_9LACT|nr:1-phosphofructokinase family hexose kinase [Carnobacterium iners]SEL13803.1 1-phosphofructokinase [Carnobacterium iners]SMH27029.1 1-phosphofructokinase [Carnobacterium iners]